MVAAGLGTSVLAGWAIEAAINSGRIVTAAVGPEGIFVPWYAATRVGEGLEDKCNHQVAGYLGEWCRQNGGLNGGQ